MVTSAGFNALLKVVEEPPEHLKFIFATTEPEKVIGTIRSRTHHYPFRLVPPGTLRDYLGEVCGRRTSRSRTACCRWSCGPGAGSVRDSMSVMDQLLAGAGEDGVTYAMATSLLGYTDGSLLDSVVDAFAAGDGAAAFEVVDRVIEGGNDPRRFVADLLERLRDLVILAAVPDAAEKGLIDAPADVVERMQAQASRLRRRRAEPGRRPGQHGAHGDARRHLAAAPAGADLRAGAAARRLRRRAVGAGPAGPAGARARRFATGRRRRPPWGTCPGPRRMAHAPGAAARAAVPPGGGRRGAGRGRGRGAGRGAAGPAPVRPRGRRPRPRRRPRRPPAARRRPPRPPRPQPAPGSPARRGPAAPGAWPAAAAAGGGRRPGGWPTRRARGRRRPPRRARARGRPRPPRAGPPPPAAPGARPWPQRRRDQVRNMWPDILEAVKNRRRFTWILLSQNAQVAGFDGTTLQLGFVNAGARDNFASSGSEDVLKQALAEQFNVQWKIEAIVDPSGGAAPPAAGGSGGSGRPAVATAAAAAAAATAAAARAGGPGAAAGPAAPRPAAPAASAAPASGRPAAVRPRAPGPRPRAARRPGSPPPGRPRGRHPGGGRPRPRRLRPLRPRPDRARAGSHGRGGIHERVGGPAGASECLGGTATTGAPRRPGALSPRPLG